MQMPPGPDSILVLARVIGQGRATALFTVLGMTVGAGMVQLPLIALGVSSLVSASHLAFKILQWAGAAYLVWLGLRLAFASSATTAWQVEDVTPLAAAREGMIANLVNPWPIGVMVAFLPQFVDPHGDLVTLQLLLLGATQKMTGVLVLGTYALASGTLGAWIMKRPRVRLWQQRIASLSIIGLGFRMAFGGGASRKPRTTTSFGEVDDAAVSRVGRHEMVARRSGRGADHLGGDGDA
ncbi:lysine transporter LysE [Mesorhizobium sp. SARCC-RB16n]|uniref:LysE family translocator n=1 Tax=Mesorhizobium sp. SARCC-RB16n TaxID=2116687 RepID=UPI00122F4CB2|nr:LysE family translocator [Mesorhizobium sp. SARCC-RB16n]KAA3442044.1 lysine transporter LysE [Mesorhizobium sp. SARCC-RB16n]